MYHIAKDRRAEKSAALIYEALLGLLGKRSLSSVTVKDVTDAAGTGRATFYRLFDNITDVLSWKCEEIFLCALEKPEKDIPPGQALVGFVESCMDNHQLLDALVRNSRLYLLQDIHMRHIDKVASLFFPGSAVPDESKPYLASLLAAIIPAMYLVWERKPGASAEELLEGLAENLALLSKLFSSARHC